jgi:electron transfer flavoprotein beta subunit
LAQESGGRDLEIIVCVKQVPGTNKVEIDPVTGTLKREGVESKMNPYDLFAVETALRLREKYGGHVHALSMGPGQAKAVLLEAVYMGADDGTLVSDRAFAGADVLSTSRTISQAVKKLGKYDLILCGKQTTDGDTAQVGAEMAEWLGIPHANNVMSVGDVKEGKFTVKVNLDSCITMQEMPLPSLLCMDADVVTPRLPSYRRKKGTEESAVLKVLTLSDFEDHDKAHYGLSGSPTQVERIFEPEKNVSRENITGSAAEQTERLYGILKQRKFV